MNNLKIYEFIMVWLFVLYVLRMQNCFYLIPIVCWSKSRYTKINVVNSYILNVFSLNVAYLNIFLQNKNRKEDEMLMGSQLSNQIK